MIRRDLIILTVLLLSHFHTNQALQCFSCMEIKSGNTACEHPNSAPFKVQNETCRTDYICAVFTTMSIQPPYEETVVRGCKPQNVCETTGSQFIKLESCKTCNTDNCNAAGRPIITATALFLIFTKIAASVFRIM